MTPGDGSDPLAARGIHKAYGTRVVLRGADLTLPERTIVGLIGENGAGKTTLLRILCGFVRADRGEVLDRGRPLSPFEPRAGLRHFGGGHTLPPRVSARVWTRLVSGEARDGLEARRVRDLSRGTRQRVGLEAWLARPNARAVVLDEPWEGLDPDGARWLTAKLRECAESGAAVLVSSHRLHDLASVCHRYAFLSEGRVRVAARDQLGGRIGGDELMREFDRMRSEP